MCVLFFRFPFKRLPRGPTWVEGSGAVAALRGSNKEREEKLRTRASGFNSVHCHLFGHVWSKLIFNIMSISLRSLIDR